MEKKKFNIKKIIWVSILAIISIAYILFLSLGWFEIQSNEIYVGLNIFLKVERNDPTFIILRIVSATILMLMISVFLRMIIDFISRFFKKHRAFLNLLSSFIKYLSIIIWIFLVLSIAGVDTTTLLAGAGILSLIVGLGAQPLIEDIIAGLFIVFEDVFDVGDIIVVDGFRGTVKEMGIRTTKIVDAGGDIKIVNNSDIRTLINMTSELSLAICDIDIEYSINITTTTNLPLTYEIYRNENYDDENATNLFQNATIKQDVDGAWYNVLEGEEKYLFPYTEDMTDIACALEISSPYSGSPAALSS